MCTTRAPGSTSYRGLQYYSCNSVVGLSIWYHVDCRPLHGYTPTRLHCMYTLHAPAGSISKHLFRSLNAHPNGSSQSSMKSGRVETVKKVGNMSTLCAKNETHVGMYVAGVAKGTQYTDACQHGFTRFLSVVGKIFGGK